MTPISTKNTGMNTAPTLLRSAADPLLLAAAADGQSGHERADDERQLGGVGEQGEAEDHDEGNDRQRGAGAGDAVDDVESRGTATNPTTPGDHEEADRPSQRSSRRRRR